MKDLFKIVLIFAAFVFVIPLVGFIGREKNSVPSEQTVSETTQTSISEPETGENTSSDEIFTVFDITSGKVMDMPMKDYLVGAVMAEMPAAYEPEALKAQAVAAYTYALRREMLESENPTPELMGAAISNDSAKFQAFFTPEQGKAFYGTAYDEYRQKIEAAVDAVYPEALFYGDEPIAAAFHSISCGKTEDSAEVWEAAFPYLVSVDSEWDKDAPTFYSENNFTADEIKAAFPDSDFDENSTISVDSLTSGGYAKRVTVGGKTYSGQEVRTALGLRSSSFTVSYSDTDKVYTFSVKGSGHGVGMSQYGANCLAKEGKNYREILEHYYTNCDLMRNF